MPKYTFTFKKGDINLEYTTDDKESMERQFQIWVTCASVWAYNQEKIEQGLMPAPLPDKTKDEKEEIEEKSVENQEKTEEKDEVLTTENSQEISSETSYNTDTSETSETSVEAEFIVSPEQDEIERESQRIIQEYKAEMEAEALKKEKEAKKEEFKNGVEQVVAKEEAMQKELSGLYEKPETIKDIEEKQPEESSELTVQDFDAFLQKSMNKAANDVKEKRDERFLKVIKVKNVTEKIDFLIVTAYYLSEFERLDRFTLKLVNAKLMENMHEIVDNSVLQEAIDRGLVECLPNYTNIPSAMEYRLTEAGEEAFLNGRSN